MLVFLRLYDNASATLLANVSLAVFMGISMALLSTFFAVEQAMQPVIRMLLSRGVEIDYRALPMSSLRTRLVICSTLIILTTGLMIGTLARQRAADIIANPAYQAEALAMLKTHSTYITVAACSLGVLFSSFLARSVASRSATIVTAMSEFRSGTSHGVLVSTGNDELDVMARQFNVMVAEIDAHLRALSELNATLEAKVQQRTEELRRNVVELHHAQAQLVNSEKMRSLGQVAAGLAHELNNSFNAVYNGTRPLRQKLCNLKALVEQPVGDGQVGSTTEIRESFARLESLAQVIENGAKRTARIVGDLQTFSGGNDENSSKLNLGDVLDMCLNLLSNELRDRILVHREYAVDSHIVAPANQLSQVFFNLLNNAQQAIADRGEIWVTIEEAESFICVTLRDSGIGIGPDLLDRMFEPFVTTKSPGSGTGLGLSISYGTIKRLGGSIECKSELGSGTEFKTFVPRHCVLPPAAANADGHTPYLQSLTG